MGKLWDNTSWMDRGWGGAGGEGEGSGNRCYDDGPLQIVSSIFYRGDCDKYKTPDLALNVSSPIITINVSCDGLPSNPYYLVQAFTVLIYREREIRRLNQILFLR